MISKNSHQKTTFYKDKSNTIWFMGVYSNNFEDRQGEIISWDAHLEYSEWFKTSGVKIPIIMMHLPRYSNAFHLAHTLAVQRGIITPKEYSENLKALYAPTTIATAEAVIPMNGFVFVLGKVREDRYEMVEKFSGEWGMSHGFARIEYDGNIINKYRTFEFTLAPVELAANPVTTIGFNKEKIMADVKTLPDEQRELIESFLDGTLEDMEAGTEKARQILSTILASKTQDNEEIVTEEIESEEEVVNESVSADYEELRNKLFEDLDVAGLVGAFKQVGEALTTLNSRMNTLEEMGKKTDDERVAEYIAPNWASMFAGHKTQGETDTELLEELKQKTEREIVDGHSTMDRKAQDNPLFVGMWQNVIPAMGEN